jgi:glycosyltransferase involved in cell wall biosynthesis
MKKIGNDTVPVRLVRIMTVPLSIEYILRGQLAYFKQNGFDVYSVSADGPEVPSIIERERVSHTVIPFTRRITPLRDLYCLVLLIWFLIRVRPHIVHTQTPKAGLLGMMAAWICRVPVRIHTIGGMPLMEARGITRSILYWSEKATYACSHQVWPNSNILCDFLLNNLNVAKSKLKVIGNGSSNGIDTEKFKRTPALMTEAMALREKHGIKSDDVVFCFVGRLVRDKGVHELVEAFSRLREKHRSVKLFLIGHFEDILDPISNQYKRLIKENESIIATGFSTEVPLYMAASDIFVFPSYREGFPNVVLQACAMELPAIVTDINGSNEIIQHQENGIIISPKSSDELFNAMELLLSNSELRKRLAEQTRARVVDLFDQRNFWDKLKQQYFKLLKERVS